MAIRGEGEDAIPAIAEQKPLEKIPNLTWKSESGDVVINQRGDILKDLDKLPFPVIQQTPYAEIPFRSRSCEAQPFYRDDNLTGMPRTMHLLFFRDVRSKNQEHVAPETS